MSRHIDRTHVFKLIFQLDFLGVKSTVEELEHYIDENLTEMDDKNFIVNHFHGIVNNLTEIDKIIEKNITGWTLTRLDKTDLNILRLAIFEILYSDIPDKVAVNEAIMLSKEFSGDDSYRFINGVLSKVIKNK